jgi:hypothetical protein
MSDQNSFETEKIEEYFRVIEQRILGPIQKSEIHRYCTATLLLLFAGIDGLGKLIHPDKNAGCEKRIRAFLSYMGSNYRTREKELYKLRNSLVHNAINVASFMSQTEMGSDQHLKRISSADIIYVNTTIMCHDFVRAFERLREEFKKNGTKIKGAAERLEWREDDCQDQYLDIPATPPPPVVFIWAKEPKKKMAERE